jgi:hypothetical protein
MAMRTAVAAVLLGVVLNACGGGAAQGGAPAGAAGNEAPGTVGTPPAYSPQVPADLKRMTEAALVDAARRTGRDPATLKVISAESVVWPDGSLGCPEPGMAYTMALVPGYRIRVDAGGSEFDYHASARGQLVLCPPGRASAPLPAERM